MNCRGTSSLEWWWWRLRSFGGLSADNQLEYTNLSSMQDGSGVSPPGEKLYSAYSQSILRKGRGMSEKNFEFIFSDTSSMGMKFSVGVPYSSTTTEEDFQELEQESSVDSSSTRCILQRKPRKGRKMLQASTFISVVLIAYMRRA